MKKILRLVGIVIGVAVLLAVGQLVFGLFSPHPDTEIDPNQLEVAEDGDVIWTCSMHPQIRQDEPGHCPLCEMELIPVEADDRDDEAHPRRLSISEAARALAEIGVSPVERRPVERPIRFFGLVEYDESRVRRVSSDVRARIDELLIDFTGSRVRKGDHLFRIYSPELISAQEEFLQASRTLQSMEESGAEGRSLVVARSSVEAARQRLRWWGVTPEQIEEIEKTGEHIDRLTIMSPIEGIVVEKHVNEGDYVNSGQAVYTVADLSHVWVRLEAYESDLPWINYGQKVTFTSRHALPGRIFEGRIVFVDPLLDRERRTVSLRVNVSNPRGELRPGMFVNAVLNAELNADGMARKPQDLEGKWISPHHPEIIADEPGNCPICGVELERAEDLGYAEAESDDDMLPLVIPSSAPLITGERALVYVKVKGEERPTYEGREIILGPRAGGYYTVLEGLEEGEMVVTKGSFKMDSELQLQGRTGMMSPPEEEEVHEPLGDVDDTFLSQFGEVLSGYVSVAGALGDDDFQAAVNSVERTLEALEAVDDDLLAEVQRDVWSDSAGDLERALHQLHHADNIKAGREAFEDITIALDNIIDRFGLPEDFTLYRLHCPMAFDNKGADWFSFDDEVLNPYFGNKMLRCGDVTEVLE